MRIGGERVYDGTGQHDVEFRGLQHAIILLPEQAEPLEQIAGEDDQQQANRRKNGGHTLLSLTHTGSWRTGSARNAVAHYICRLGIAICRGVRKGLQLPRAYTKSLPEALAIQCFQEAQAGARDGT